MSRALILHETGPGVTVQDLGRPGWLAEGLSRGGAADRLALLEGAALLGQGAENAALEMAGFGGVFEATERMRIALTGAPMAARVGERALEWNAVHVIAPGERLAIGGARTGVYGYLHVGGGIATEPVLGSRAAHLAARILGRLRAGVRLPVGPDPDPGAAELRLEAAARCEGGEVRLLPVPQTLLFAEDDRRRFEDTVFTRDRRGNRQGVRLSFDGAPFLGEAGLSLVSEVVQPGDVQMTGDGAPYVLLPECQTTGGYPRIGTVLPCDLPRVAQAAPGTALRFRFVSLDEALALHRTEAETLADLRRRLRPMVRSAEDIPDLLGYQLISGVTAGTEGGMP
jgi:5-oxoprolinase (ATP-hydrolysing) subunit C